MVKYYAADFETTVYEGQDKTEVWSAGICPFYSESVELFSDIVNFMFYVFSLKHNVVCYFHNLKFDGSFILNYLISNQMIKIVENNTTPNKELCENDCSCVISQYGVWYKFAIKKNGYIYEFRDSLKLIPLSLSSICKSFDTKHKKTEIEYAKKRKAGDPITQKEREYQINDVLALKEALEYMYSQKHKKLTIGSCCIQEIRKQYGNEYEEYFPDLSKIEISESYGAKNADEYIRHAYHGGKCMVNEKYQNKIIGEGVVFDINSMYPYNMHSSSKNYIPIGVPTFFKGVPPQICLDESTYYFIRFKCRFKIKDGYIPYMQLKSDYHYRRTDIQKTSDLYYKGKYYYYVRGENGEVEKIRPVITMSRPDFEQFVKYHDIYDMEYIDGCYFKTELFLFDDYINRYMKIKKNSTGAKRTVAKLFLNNLYGKLCTSVDDSYKLPYVEDGVLKFRTVESKNKPAGHIASGSSITSYAQCYLVERIQANRDLFLYCDTDSLHLLKSDHYNLIDEDNSELGKWKRELEFEKAKYIRAKTYIEINKNDIEIRCAGMPQHCKDLLEISIKGGVIKQPHRHYHLLNKRYKIKKRCKLQSATEREFLTHKRPLKDITFGLTVPGKLQARQIQGGVVLSSTEFKIVDKKKYVAKFVRKYIDREHHVYKIKR